MRILEFNRRRLRTVGSIALLALLLLLGVERLLGFIYPYPLDCLARHGESRRIFSRDGRLLRITPTRLGERLLRTTPQKVSPHLIKALLAGEDKAFLSHSGVHFPAVARACLTNFFRGRIISGASTLTMQVARIVEPRPRTYRGKLFEMFRARQLERILPKDRILGLYLSLAPLGGTRRGFATSSRYWFGKDAADLTPAEAATLVAMLPAPSRRAPHRHPEQLLLYRNRILQEMHRHDYLETREYELAKAQPLGARIHQWPFLAPHACDYLLATNNQKEIHSRIDLNLHGRTTRILQGETRSGVDGAGALILERKSGAIVAMVGSRDYGKQPLNTCICHRAAGSTLKPFLYALAMEKGIIGSRSLIADRPCHFRDYTPRNFSRDYAGAISVAAALHQSRNLPAIRLLQRVGVDAYRDLLSRLGCRLTGEQLHLDLALGTVAISPLELGRAWREFADPHSPMRLGPTSRNQVLTALRRSTPDWRLLAPGRAAWKTGTSSNRRDAWAAGVTDKYVIVVWMGNLDGTGAPGLTGAKCAAPVFARIVATLPTKSWTRTAP